MDFDFSFFLVAATFVTGFIWGAFRLWLKISDKEYDQQAEPLLVEYARSFFPIILIVLFLRSFLVEPFRIPSASMMPTLLIGDFILVNKFAYGVRLPVLDTKIVEIGEPKRGDIVVFRFPKQPSIDYIKRVVGLPGDRVSYYKKRVYINGKPVKLVSLGRYQGVGQGKNMTGAELFLEDLSGTEHDILIMRGAPTVEGVYIVPEGHYFVMGDNRDNSNDSRYWGTVPEANLVGKAFFIWMSWDWQNKGIGFDRIGTVLK
jgi:signal peptidase I